MEDHPGKAGGAVVSEYLTPCQVAKRLGKRVETIREWISKGELRATNLGKSQVRMRVRPEWIADFERSRMAIPPAKQGRSKISKPPVEYV